MIRLLCRNVVKDKSFCFLLVVDIEDNVNMDNIDLDICFFLCFLFYFIFETYKKFP